ncbi:MAG: SDR family oxidoreductase [Steroidobacteraceae bacterium]
MDLGLRDKIAIVAGGSRGCGRGIAEELAREGAAVVLSGRHAQTVAATTQAICGRGGRAHGVVADMAVKDDATRIVAEARRVFGDPHILVVNPVGPPRSRGFEGTSDEEFRLANDAWIMTLVYLAREVLPGMKARRWGRIVDIASIGVKTPHLEDPMYTSNTRVGVVGVVKTLAHEYGRYNITANVIATGPFLTELSRSYMADAGALSAEQMMSLTAMGRWGRPEEMGAVVAFLCSERATYLSGETIRVDGGYSHSLF